MPRLAFCTKCCFHRLPIDLQFKTTGSTRGFPRCNPIPSAHPNTVSACFGDIGMCVRISDGYSHSMCKQKGRAHLVREFLIDDPSPNFGETLRFNQHKMCV